MRRLAGNDPEVNEEWITDKDRFAFTYAAEPDRLTYPQVRDEDGALRPASWPEAFAVAARGPRRRPQGRRSRCADRWPADRRGRLRLRQVRPRRARHQRHRLPRPPALAPRRPTSWPPTSSRPAPSGGAVTYADLETRLDRRARRASSPRTRPARSSCACARPPCTSGTRVLAIAPFTTRGLTKMHGTLLPTAPGDEPATMSRAARPRRPRSRLAPRCSWSASAWPPCPARLSAVADAGRQVRCPRGLGAASRR